MYIIFKKKYPKIRLCCFVRSFPHLWLPGASKRDSFLLPPLPRVSCLLPPAPCSCPLLTPLGTGGGGVDQCMVSPTSESTSPPSPENPWKPLESCWKPPWRPDGLTHNLLPLSPWGVNKVSAGGWASLVTGYLMQFSTFICWMPIQLQFSNFDYLEVGEFQRWLMKSISLTHAYTS